MELRYADQFGSLWNYDMLLSLYFMPPDQIPNMFLMIKL